MDFTGFANISAHPAGAACWWPPVHTSPTLCEGESPPDEAPPRATHTHRALFTPGNCHLEFLDLSGMAGVRRRETDGVCHPGCTCQEGSPLLLILQDKASWPCPAVQHSPVLTTTPRLDTSRALWLPAPGQLGSGQGYFWQRYSPSSLCSCPLTPS